MTIEDLIRRSPIGVLEQAIHGGLQPGETGVIAAPAGLGKTSVLVQIGLYKLLQGKKVIHVSFTKHTDYVLAWYEDIFDEFIKKKSLEHAAEVKDSLVKNRVLMNFNQESMGIGQVLKSLRAMITDGGFVAESLIIDGLDFSRVDTEDFTSIKDFARELKLSVWHSCSADATDYNERKIPKTIAPYADLVDVLITLEQIYESNGSHIELSVSKARGDYRAPVPPLKLDPKTLLVLEE